MYLKQRDASSLGRWYWTNIILSIVFVMLLFQIVRKYMDYRYAQKTYHITYAEYTDIDHQKKELELKVVDIKTTDGLEDYLREQYRAVKPGEQLVIFLEDTKSASALLAVDSMDAQTQTAQNTGLFLKTRLWYNRNISR